MPLRVIVVWAMPALTKHRGFTTGTGRVLDRERKILKKGLKEFLPGPEDPLTGSAHNLANYQLFSKNQVHSFNSVNLHIQINTSFNLDCMARRPQKVHKIGHISIAVTKKFHTLHLKKIRLKFLIWLIN